MSYALYQDPMQSQPMVIPANGIGNRLTPESWSLKDPALLRHVLATMITLRNLFHFYLCWRQIRKCTIRIEPPPELQGVMSKEQFKTAKNEEMHAVENMMVAYIFDAILSCIELYLSVFPMLWRLVMKIYSIVDDLIWQSIAFVALFSTYMVIRTLPQIFYSRMFLTPFYDPQREKSLPLVGLLCSFTLLVVLLQVGLVPLTAIFLVIETTSSRFFLLWIWGVLILISSIAILSFCLFGLPCLGAKVKAPVDENLKNVLQDILQKFGFKPEHIYILRTFQNMSPTAYAWGCYCYRRVFIMESLLLNHGKPVAQLQEEDVGKGLEDNQLEAYIAHELFHWRSQDVLKAFAIIHVTLLIYFLLFGTVYRQDVLYEAAGFQSKFYPPIVGYWLVYKYVMPLYLTITNWIIFYVLRYLEYEADLKVWKLGYGAPYVDALVKLFGDSPTYPYMDDWYLMWYRYRPTTLLRIRRLDKMVTRISLRRQTRGTV
ncbi:hypothetical protein AWZ03_005418 [Drosophila navojoa]|uniref:Uncharacterized protein n=2 Tax=Drosophila navojoa TaxID=7232 RepID=A0A484BHI2_DRONA|nr:CAAX prenyl protease 1 homolog isoform X1 [Drosophila navojoa]TDG48243.1 hypothetical protein AWZ03_005418 [Drosophila navojoa]